MFQTPTFLFQYTENAPAYTFKQFYFDYDTYSQLQSYLNRNINAANGTFTEQAYKLYPDIDSHVNILPYSNMRMAQADND